jgi:hypothetical protein
MSSKATNVPAGTSTTRKRVVDERVNDVAGASASSKRSRPTGAKESRKRSTTKTKKLKFKGFPQGAPLMIPAKVDRNTKWRWYEQWQVWQARRRDTRKKTLFCGLCGFVSPSRNEMLKHFLAEHGDKKFYKCWYCDRRFCLLTNVRMHSKEVHGEWKFPWYYEWGPEHQHTIKDEYEVVKDWSSDDEDEEEHEDDEDDEDDEYEEKSGQDEDTDADESHDDDYDNAGREKNGEARRRVRPRVLRHG